MYCTINFRTKKELKEAVQKGQNLTIFSPGPFPPPTSGVAFLEGPHYPQPHTWYAKVWLENGRIVKVLS